MSVKKNQHIVPRCYLKRFVDNSVDNGNTKFKPGIYSNSKKLNEKWRMRGLDHNSFTKPRFYNLQSDDETSPIVEEYLSRIEYSYDIAVRDFLNGSFSNKIQSTFTAFVLHQFLRSESLIINIQNSYDRIASYADLFENNNRNKELYSDISKKMLLQCNNSDLELVHNNSAILINCTQIPFLTSDKPVIAKQFNSDDVEEILYLAQLCQSHLETTFFYMPITPWLAYVSHNSLRREIKGIECKSEVTIANLNDMMISNSDKRVYSFMQNPLVKKLTQGFTAQQERHSIYVKIFTANKRLIFNINSYNHELARLSLSLDDSIYLDNLFIGQMITSIEIFDPTFNRIVPISAKRDCVIEAKSGVTLILKSRIPFPR
ncbi:DUF4238 domain-containing protein [Pseudoalteromonas arctica]|uniref:DUF4238 domain-containing protein n=1 Tax=Pseudoalteromonas arctica A 37-1-2 TaxID=1117313 RepID=A0A290RZW6_9GAMM|nr:DUF4238 domain-containing protein [Pseudoalteromonas arctica]ATC85542.1 hypothetical protein PARC_a0855 [Pseudoalteromonas arctica A 37-1-2]